MRILFSSASFGNVTFIRNQVDQIAQTHDVPFLYWLHEKPHDYYKYTRFSLENMAESSGFSIIVLEEIGGALESATGIFSKSVCNYGRIGRKGSSATQIITRFHTKITYWQTFFE